MAVRDDWRPLRKEGISLRYCLEIHKMRSRVSAFYAIAVIVRDSQRKHAITRDDECEKEEIR